MAATSLVRHVLYATTRGAISPRSSVKPSWHKELNRFSLYACSSWFYTVVGVHGLCMFLSCPTVYPGWPPHIAIPDVTLVMLQGIWSFNSDVRNIGLTSKWHVVDRLTAQALTLFQVVKFAYFLVPPVLSPAQFAFVWFGFFVAFFCKLQGYKAIVDASLPRFKFWHTLWHISLPLTHIILQSWRWRGCALG